MAQKKGRPKFSSPPKEVVRLTLTRRRSSKSENWFVEAPLKRGPQPCIIKQTDTKKRVIYRDAVVVLPSITPSCRPSKNPVVGAALMVAEYAHRAVVAEYSENKPFMRLIPKKVTFPPYRGASDNSLVKDLEHAIDVWKRNSFITTLDDSVGSVIADASAQLAYWTPWVIKEDQVPKIEGLKEMWAIVHNWHRWSGHTMTWPCFFEIIYKRTDRKTPSPGDSLVFAVRDFKNRCKKMGLIPPQR